MAAHFGDLFFAHWYTTFILTFVFFALLYFGFAFAGIVLEKLFTARHIGHTLGEPAVPAKQLRREILHSLVSVFIFALLAIPIQAAYKKDIIHIVWTVHAVPLIIEIILLFLWNELHFYISHRLLHSNLLFSRVHYVHHKSKTPTVFSTYSFHWFEAILLGSVIYLPLLFFDLQFIALLSLPIMSIALNTLGHWNYDLFPSKQSNNLLKFTYRHSGHHKYFKGNYGFFLPIFDSLFNTKAKEHE